MAIFLVGGPAIILYSQGYRLDIANRKIVQTGAFYFRVDPRSVEIEINSLAVEKTISKSTDFIFGTAFIENLLPAKYSVTLKKDRFHPWRKELEINEKMVTEIKNVTLVPENPEFSVSIENIDDFFYFPETDKIVIKTTKNDTGKKFQQLSSYNSRSGTVIPFFSYDEKTLVEKLEISQRSEKALIKTERNNLFVYHIADLTGKNEPIILDLPKETNKILFDSANSRKLIFLNEGNLFSHNYETKEEILLANNVSTFNLRANGNLFWLSNEGFLMRNPGNPQKINKTPLEIETEAIYEIFFPNSIETMIKKNDKFYLLDRETLEFKKTFETSYDPVVSPDLQKIAYHNNHEIRIFFLQTTIDQPQRSYGETVFLTRFSERIENVNWYTSHYLSFTVSDEIKIIEIDNRDNINIVSFEKPDMQKMFFNYRDKKFYILKNKEIFVSKQMI